MSHSKNSESKNSSPSDKKDYNFSEDLGGEISNKRYLDSQHRNSSGYLDRVNDLIKKSQLVKDQSLSKLLIPYEADELRSTERSPTFPSFTHSFPTKR